MDNAIEKIARLGQAIVDASHIETPAVRRRKRLIRISIGLGFLTTVASFIVVKTLHRATELSRAKQTWEEQDQKLDRDVESTFDASDPITKY